jgi:hypothetical protein
MTENQRAEFERQKHISENQLREMYYGRNNSKEGLKVPSFIKASQPEQKQTSESQATVKTNAHPINETKPSATPKKRNILELINLKNLVLDDDRILLVSLCLLLSHEEADELLIMALIYIML